MKTLTVLDPRAAFVDVGSEHMHVSVAGEEPVVFGTVTSQLHALRDWLKSQGVRSVAMEATGVYWLPLYGVLALRGSVWVACAGACPAIPNKNEKSSKETANPRKIIGTSTSIPEAFTAPSNASQEDCSTWNNFCNGQQSVSSPNELSVSGR